MTQPSTSGWVHGGTDALGAPRLDFSTNSNACGPCPAALAALQSVDCAHYPDPNYTALRQSLAAFHGVLPARVLLAGSASEFIFRITAWARQQGCSCVQLPAHAYGDYARAAQAWGLPTTDGDTQALSWACEPSSPLGQTHAHWPSWLTTAQAAAGSLLVLDRAYAPLRLSGTPSLSTAQLQRVWQLFSPNKALGLTGVRAAYVIAPNHYESRATGLIDVEIAAVNQLAPSWPLGAHGVALLQAWVTPLVQSWLADCLPRLRDWKARQIDLLQGLGWTCQPSEANFFCARPAQPIDLAALRAEHGIKLRDCASFGLPGWFRLGVLAPQAQDTLSLALRHVKPLDDVNLAGCVSK